MSSLPPSRNPRQLGLIILALAFAIFLGFLGGWTAHGGWSKTTAQDDRTPAGPELRAGVTPKDGGRLSLPDGTTIEVPPGSVSASTELVATRAGSPPPPPTGLDRLGAGLKVSLADGAELTGPATITMVVDAPPDWPSTIAFTPLLGYFDQDAQAWRAVDADYDPSSHLLSASVDHFSWWNPFSWDYAAIGDSVTAALAGLAGRPSGQPVVCADPPPNDQITLTQSGSDLVDHCLDQVDGGTVLRLRGVKNYPLLISWSGIAKPISGSDYRLDLKNGYQWFVDTFDLLGEDAAILQTGADLDLQVAPDANAAVTVSVTYDPRTQLAGIVDATVGVISAIRGATGAETTAEEIWSYLQDGVCAEQSIDNLGDDFVQAATTIVVECASHFLSEVTKKSGGFLALLGGLPKVVAQLVGVIGSAINVPISQFDAGRDLFSDSTDEDFLIATPDSPDGSEVPDGASSPWPVDDDEGPPNLYIWFGANMYGFPDFVSCAARYCIAGIDDDVIIIELDGLVDRGHVPLASKDPAKALQGKGLDSGVITAVLTRGPA